jgi:hypothetical protein
MYNTSMVTVNLLTLNILLGLWVFIFVLLYPFIKLIDLLDP